MIRRLRAPYGADARCKRLGASEAQSASRRIVIWRMPNERLRSRIRHIPAGNRISCLYRFDLAFDVVRILRMAYRLSFARPAELTDLRPHHSGFGASLGALLVRGSR